MKPNYHAGVHVVAELLGKGILIAIDSAHIKDQIPDLNDLVPGPFSTTNRRIELKGEIQYFEWTCPQYDSTGEYIRIHWEKGIQTVCAPTIRLLGHPLEYPIYDSNRPNNSPK